MGECACYSPKDPEPGPDCKHDEDSDRGSPKRGLNERPMRGKPKALTYSQYRREHYHDCQHRKEKRMVRREAGCRSPMRRCGFATYPSNIAEPYRAPLIGTVRRDINPSPKPLIQETQLTLNQEIKVVSAKPGKSSRMIGLFHCLAYDRI